MGKKLSIKGHLTRSKEVIELFKMMGGCDCGYGGGGTSFYYYISQFGNIEASCKPYEFDTYIVYTLEEFLEKYPYKVGDVIKFPNDMAEEIAEMKWDEELKDIIYTSVSGCTRPSLVPKTKKEKKINQMSLANCDLDEVEIVLGDRFELKIKDGKYYAVRKKPTYPKLTNLSECKEILGEKDMYQSVSGYKGELLTNFQRLLIFRDAYWKIAGEVMGLDKPWTPKYETLVDNTFFTIQTFNGEINKSGTSHRNSILAFPTEEMRDVFYENFKDLIEECKELL